MSYSIKNITAILNATAIINSDTVIDHLLIDSRKIIFPATSIFFALHSKVKNGHSFISEVYERGVRNFVIDEAIDTTKFIGANFLLVNNTLAALQLLATYHRSKFNSLTVIGITGSNGKTIVKEWLNELLQTSFNIVRSPRSYNSQIGVPLSVWQINERNTLGIFEAGISTINEMENLQKIIQPSIGILTNIANAHNEGFINKEQKFSEKFKLFSHCKQIIVREEDYLLYKDLIVKNENTTIYTWGNTSSCSFYIKEISKQLLQTEVTIIYNNKNQKYTIPFTDNASIENAISCICVLLLLNINEENIARKIIQLQPVEMRMQLKKAINNCYVINDSYSNDISSLTIALDYLKQQSGNQNTTVILSDILQSGISNTELYNKVAALIKQKNIHQFIGIGEQIFNHKTVLENAVNQSNFFKSVEEFLLHKNTHQFKDEYILIKGARVFSFERINEWFEYKVHQTVLEINLNAIANNLKQYQNNLEPGTKLMAMVKAFSYGSGSFEIARLLQYHKVDYLAVAYADEGVELRKAGINLPIMVMNIDEAGFNSVIDYNLEPEIYSFKIYKTFHAYLQKQGISQFPIHLKINTGMNRLGFDENEINEIAHLFKNNQTMVVQSVFSHLTSSEDETEDTYTFLQAQIFKSNCNEIEKIIGYPFIKHIANSAAALRHKSLQLDMVRLGIGLYGVDTTHSKINLQTVATLKTTIAQIRSLNNGDTVGYNRKGILERNSKIATLRIGYADGFNRHLGNGIGSVYIKGQFAKVIGNVCMDMIMIDVTDINNIEEDDEVEIFGNHIFIQQVAKWCNTISYEIMTTVSQRVKRIYIEE